jgi:hypothetical protein
MKCDETLLMFGLGAVCTIGAMSFLGSSPAETAPPLPVTSGPVVVELFTSQGCSSCPPADAYMAELARDPSIVALSRPVTYWDRLGWKDTLARPENTNLQRDYAQHGAAGAGVYTPQIVVQGGAGAVGSDRAKVRQLVGSARTAPKLSLSINGQNVTVSGSGKPAEVRLIAIQSTRSVTIGRGENGGRVVKYSNVVRAEKTLGRWTGPRQSYDIPANYGHALGADRRAIVVQQADAGAILAARYLP